MLIDDYFVVLELDQEKVIVNDDEPSRFLHHTVGTISGLGESGDSVQMGRFGLYYIDVQGAERAGESLFDVFDSESSTFDYFNCLYDVETEQISENVEQALGEGGFFSNLLILDRLEILPQFRRRGLGSKVIRTLIARFSPGADLVAMKPFPLQLENSTCDISPWRNELQLEKLSRNETRSTGKLRRHYASVGFKRVRGTPYMVLCPNDL